MFFFFRKIYLHAPLAKIVSFAVVVSFLLHLTAIHPTNVNLVICKKGNAVAVEKVNSDGNCEHPRQVFMESAFMTNHNDCEDTPLFGHIHDYETGKIRTGNPVLFASAYILPRPAGQQICKVFGTYFNRHPESQQSKIVETHSILI